MHGTPPCECVCGAASAAGTGAFSNLTSEVSASKSEILGVRVYWFTTVPAGFSRTIEIELTSFLTSTELMFPGTPLIVTDAVKDVAPIETCVVPFGHTTSYAVTAPSNLGSSTAGAFLNPSLALKFTSPPSTKGSCASTERKLITAAMAGVRDGMRRSNWTMTRFVPNRQKGGACLERATRKV